MSFYSRFSVEFSRMVVKLILLVAIFFDQGGKRFYMNDGSARGVYLKDGRWLCEREEEGCKEA
uniref:Uncharacterized protein n=1 Tax=Nelumbo nucifera TaxID=4432 RepID=A0A822ZNK5_NELNU|nr:TPA_asm: hypothetical protein HUJ06_017521 [Nelumbo nucifera]